VETLVLARVKTRETRGQLAAQETGSPNLLWAGLVIFLLCGTGAAADFALRGISPRAAMLAGCLFLPRGRDGDVRRDRDDDADRLHRRHSGRRSGLQPCLPGRVRDDPHPGHPGQRAGLVTAVFAVGYLGFSIPALIAGVATTKFGLHSTALVYSASLAALVAAAIGILLVRPGGKATRPAGPR
jgi:hypothetical protein